MAALSYMQRRASGIYEFRKRLPEALAGKAVPAHMREDFGDLINASTGRFKRELVRSLQTKDFKEAKRRDHRVALKAIRLFDDAVQALAQLAALQASPQLDLKQLGDDVFAELLKADESERVEGDDRRYLQTPKDREKWPLLAEVPPAGQIGMSQDHFVAYGDLLPEFEAEYREAMARRDPSIVFAETNIALKQRGIYLSRSSHEFQSAALIVLAAHVRAYDAMNRRQRGELVQTPATVNLVAALGPRLSEAFSAWCEGDQAHNAKKPNNNSITEAKQAVRYFKELHGDLRLGEITRRKAREFRDAVAKVPKNLTEDLRSLPLPKLLERDLTSFAPREASTVNKIVQVLGGIVSRAARDGHLDDVQGFSNPFDQSIRYRIDSHEARRKLFDKADLRSIFSSPVYSSNARPAGGGGEAAFWFPLIALFSGMRLDEIAQLRIRDLMRDEETGRWAFDVDRTGDRRTKNTSSIRIVPLHKALEAIGLLDYREALLRSGAASESSLWPHVKANGARPRSAAWSKWFGRYLRSECLVEDEKKVFHTFRHQFKRMCRDALLPEELHDALTGHSNKNNVGRSYGKGYSLKPLVAAIDAVHSPIDLGELLWRSGVQ